MAWHWYKKKRHTDALTSFVELSVRRCLAPTIGPPPSRLHGEQSIARTCILDGLRERLLSPEGVARARRRVAERFAELSRQANAELDERRKRLDRTQVRIAGLVNFIADGDRSEAVVSALHDLEAQAKAEKAAIAEVRERAAAPIHLPSPDEIATLAFDLGQRLTQDPVRGREELRRLLKDGKILLDPQPGRYFIARADLLPALLLLGGKREERRPGLSQAACSSWSSGGRI